MRRISRNTREKVKIFHKSVLGFLALFLLFLTVFFESGQEAKAASAAISIQTKNKQVTIGENVYITITVRSVEVIKGFEGYFSYDNTYLKFVTGGSKIQGNDDRFRILDVERSAGSNALSYSVKFEARKSGTTSIMLKKPYNVLADDENGSKMSVSHQPLSITIEGDVLGEPKETETSSNKKAESEVIQTPLPTKKAEKTDSNKLKSVEITGVELAPLFHKDIKKYSGIIVTKEEQLTINYEAFDEEAKVTVKGNENLKEGKNEIKIVVKSTKGKKRVYRFSITVDRETETVEKQEETTSTTPTEDEKLEQMHRKVQSYQYMFGIVVVFSALVILLIVALHLRSKRKNK